MHTRLIITVTHIVCGAVLLSLVSCVHRPFADEYYFQAMGEPQDIVVTMDMSRIERLPGGQSLLDSDEPSFAQLLSRIDRLSVSLYNPRPSVSEDGVLSMQDIASYEFHGGLEGNIPAFLTNSMLLWSDDWEKIEEDRIRYYRNEWLGLDIYAPQRGLLLFASDNYMKAYQETFKHRVTRIHKGLADRMAKALFGFYIASPQAMIDVGLALPKTVLAQISSMVLVIEEDETGELSLGGIITMHTPKLANSLSILLKSSYISEKRRNREPLGDLTNLFLLEDSAVHINGMSLSEEQYASFSELFGSLTSITTGVKR